MDNTSSVGFGLLQVTDERRTSWPPSSCKAAGPSSQRARPPAAGTDASPAEPRLDLADGGLPILPPDGADGTAAIGADGVVASSETIARTVDTPSGRLTVTAASPVDQVARSVDALREALRFGPGGDGGRRRDAWVPVGRALRPVDAIRAEVDEITGSTMHRRVHEPPPATRSPAWPGP